MTALSLRGKAAIVGIGETDYHKRGQSPEPEFKMALQAIVAACADAGIDVAAVDGLVSYHNERSEPARLAAALGLKELRFSNLQWGGGGGGGSAAMGHAAMALACGVAENVVVFRSLAQGQFARYGAPSASTQVSGDAAFQAPYGMFTPAQRFALTGMRFMERHGIGRSALRAIAMASYHHAQRNPRAVMYGKPLSEQQYDESRWIAEPYRLFDCCMENDGAAAVVMVSAERAKRAAQKPAYLMAVAQGCDWRAGARLFNAPDFDSGGFGQSHARLYRDAGLNAHDMDFVQCYENFTTGVLMALVEHSLIPVDGIEEWCTLESLTAPGGRLPLNTSGGNLAECYMHGLEHHIEAVRQLRGGSTAQVPNAKAGIVISGPMVAPTSSLILGSEEVL